MKLLKKSLWLIVVIIAVLPTLLLEFKDERSATTILNFLATWLFRIDLLALVMLTVARLVTTKKIRLANASLAKNQVLQNSGDPLAVLLEQRKQIKNLFSYCAYLLIPILLLFALANFVVH